MHLGWRRRRSQPSFRFQLTNGKADSPGERGGTTPLFVPPTALVTRVMSLLYAILTSRPPHACYSTSPSFSRMLFYLPVFLTGCWHPLLYSLHQDDDPTTRVPLPQLRCLWFGWGLDSQSHTEPPRYPLRRVHSYSPKTLSASISHLWAAA